MDNVHLYGLKTPSGLWTFSEANKNNPRATHMIIVHEDQIVDINKLDTGLPTPQDLESFNKVMRWASEQINSGL